jgi:HEAT repeat protein
MDCVPIFLEGLRNPDQAVRGAAVQALGRTPSSDPAILPALVGALEDPAESVREAAVDAIGMRGPSALPDPSTLRSLSTSPARTVRHAVALSLGRLGDPRAVPILIALVADGEARVRREAAWAIGRVGDEGQRAVGALGRALSDGDSGVRYWAACSLERLRRPDRLRDALLDPDPGVRLVAQRALARAGELVLDSDICRR